MGFASFSKASRQSEFTLLVVSNCQTLPLFAALKELYTADRVKNFSYLAGEAKVLEELRAIEGFVTLITSANEDLIKSMESFFDSRLLQIVRIPEIYFPAFHPDQTYFHAKNNEIIKSPIGDYHSKLVIYSYMQGLSELECEKLFREDIFQSIGYFDLWSESILEIRRRCEKSDLDIECLSHFLSGQEVFMNSFNHPNTNVVRALVTGILKEIDSDLDEFLENSNFDSHDYLFGPGLIYPVFPEIAQLFGVDGNYTFWAEDGRKYNLSEFISSSYGIYLDNRLKLPAVDEFFSSRFLEGMRVK